MRIPPRLIALRCKSEDSLTRIESTLLSLLLGGRLSKANADRLYLRLCEVREERFER